MLGRRRACAAVLRETDDGQAILMVKFRTFWTLPGGGLEPGEGWEAAAVRELFEETCLRGVVERHLFTRDLGVNGDERGYVVNVSEEQEPQLGSDPELLGGAQDLQAVAWIPLSELADDVQVRLVLKSLDPRGQQVMLPPR